MELIPFVNLLEQRKVGKLGKSIFMYQMPAVEFGILLREELTGTKIDYELEGYYHSTFQVVVRDTEYTPAKDKIMQVIRTLKMQNDFLGGSLIRYCRPRTEPVPYQMSPGNQVEFSVIMEICFCGEKI